MGNVSSVKLKEDIAHLEINEKLVQEFQYHIKLVDHSMAAFARTTNSLRESFATVKQHKDDGNGDSSVNGVDGGAELGNALKYMTILETIDDALSDQSFIVVDSLTRLLNFIIETGKRCNTIIPDDALLFINKYKSETFADVLDKEMQYHDVVIESMQKKLKRVNESYRLAKREIDNLNKREALYQDEKLLLNNRIHDLETNSSNMKLELEIIRKDKNALETNNVDLIHKIEEAQREISIEQSNFEMLSKTLQSEKDECLKNVSETLNKNEELQKTLNDKQHEIDLLKAELSNEIQNVTSLKEQNEIKIKSLETEKQKLDEDNGHLKSLQEQIDEVLKKHHIEDRSEMVTHEMKTKTLVLDEISKVNAKVDDASKNMISLNETVTRMTNEVLKSKEEKIVRCRSKITMLKSQNAKQAKEKEELEKKIIDSKCQLNGLTSELLSEREMRVKVTKEYCEKNSSLQDKIAMMSQESSDLKELHNKVTVEIEETARNEKQFLEKEIKERDDKIQSLEKEINEEGKQRSVDESQIGTKRQQEERKEEVNGIEPLLKDITYVINEKNGLTTDSEEIFNEINRIRKQIEEKDKLMQSLENEITSLKDEKKAQKSCSDEQIKSLEIRLELATKQKLFVQVVHLYKTKASEIQKELQHKLKLRFNQEKIDLQFSNITHEYVMMSDAPVLCVCSRQSGLTRDKDISKYTKQFSKGTNKKTVLVFLHDKDQKSFQKEGGGKGSCRDSTFCAVFDIIYSKDTVCEWDENFTNINSIFEFIKTVCK